MSAKPEFHLGIIGGCLSHQVGIPMSMLYHRQMAAHLLETTGIQLRVHITRDFSRAYHERLAGLLCGSPIDAVLLHVRMAHSRKARVVVALSSDDRIDYFVNPALWSRRGLRVGALDTTGFKNGIKILSRKISGSTAEAFERPAEGGRVFGLYLKQINQALGELLRLDQWAIDDEMHLLETFRDTCRERKLPFLILGPTPAPDAYWTQRQCHKMNQQLADTLPTMGVPYAIFDHTIGQDGRHLVNRDGIHLNVAGHTYVANLLYKHVELLAMEHASAQKERVSPSLLTVQREKRNSGSQN
jgi:hypothetical protein